MGISRYTALPKPLRIAFMVLVSVTIMIAIYYRFHGTFAGLLYDKVFYYFIMATLGSCVFLIFPARKNLRKFPWYDMVAAVLLFGISMYFFSKGHRIMFIGMDFVPKPNDLHFALGVIVIILLLEAARRIGGISFFLTCIVIGTYPLYAGELPGILGGIQFDPYTLVGSYVFASEGIMGLPARVLGEILMGFLIFAGVLLASGAGDFFIKLAYSMMGRFRGGPAKVAVVASGFFGSLSGSIASNIVGTGSITIPAMKRLGYPAHYAGAIEACASTGGVLMPPIMGATAFIMAEILGIEYALVITAAFIPSILYYLGLLIGVDGYAAKADLKGLPREEIPNLWATLKDGWIFIFVIVFLVWGLLYMRWETITPYYASALLIVLVLLRKLWASFRSRQMLLDPRKSVTTIGTVGTLLVQVTGIILPMGLILGGLQLPGMVGALTKAFVDLGGTSVWLMLLIGVAVCYIFGTLGMSTPAYVILSITMAPAVVQASGLNTLAVHLFILYYAMLASITPPVALGAFIAASLAGAPPMKTAWTAMRLGVVIYFIPFFFVFNPALVLQGGEPIKSLYFFTLAVVGIIVLAAGVEGYLFWVGKLRWWERPPLIAGGFLIAYPELLTSLIGGVATAVLIVVLLALRKRPLKRVAT